MSDLLLLAGGALIGPNQQLLLFSFVAAAASFIPFAGTLLKGISLSFRWDFVQLSVFMSTSR